MMNRDHGNRMPVYFGTRASMNRNPVYVGTPAAFCKWLRMYKRGSTEWRAAMVCGGSLVGVSVNSHVMRRYVDTQVPGTDCVATA